MEILWPAVIIGIVAIAVGVITIFARKSIASGTAEGQRAMFGKVGDKLARTTTPAGPLIAGIGAVGIGVALIVSGLFFGNSF